jgi:flavin reductase (DIM6/NTAB) family NADH-FMN oxidoreductase RutF
VVEAPEFKDFMAKVPTCVAVVASLLDDDIQACTVSSLTSFDIEDPGVLIVLKNNSRTLRAIKQSKNFSAGILSDNQVALAIQFAAKEKDLRVDRGQYFENLSQFSMPYLKSCKGIIFCELVKIEELKHASIIFGKVLAILNLEKDSPLIYSNRKFFTLGQSLT